MRLCEGPRTWKRARKLWGRFREEVATHVLVERLDTLKAPVDGVRLGPGRRGTRPGPSHFENVLTLLVSAKLLVQHLGLPESRARTAQCVKKRRLGSHGYPGRAQCPTRCVEGLIIRLLQLVTALRAAGAAASARSMWKGQSGWRLARPTELRRLWSSTAGRGSGLGLEQHA